MIPSDVDEADSNRVVGQRELVVIAKTGAVSMADTRLASRIRTSLSDAFRDEFEMRPLFPVQLDALREDVSAESSPRLAEEARYFHIAAPDKNLEALAAELRSHPEIETAYVRPAGETPIIDGTRINSARMASVTPDFTPAQTYLGPAPEGVNVHAAWPQAGGRGEGVKIVDLEWNWRFDHEDLQERYHKLSFGTVAGSPEHGTAVMGVIGGDDNGFGIIGICPDAWVANGAFSVPTATAIALATAQLAPGDLLLLEIHLPGPRYGFTARSDEKGYIAIEWWPDVLLAIRSAVAKGIIVVEPAGNGSEDLDDPLYDTPAPNFPPGWRNPFARQTVDSGAIVVGAGAPPPGTHGRDWGPDRSRLAFSNFGSVVDAQGWGREVTSTGYGDVPNGPNPNAWYTNVFAGTSSAAPMIVGVLCCLQGIRRANGVAPLTSMQARAALRMTGSPQDATAGGAGRIGNRPNLAQLVANYSR